MIINKTTSKVGQVWRPFFFNANRQAHVTKHVFNGELRPNKVHHYVLQPQLGDTQLGVSKQIQECIKVHKNSLIYLTQKSRIQINTAQGTVPMPRVWLDDIDLFNQAVSEELLSPEPGHTSMGITDHHGNILPDMSVSLRKGDNISMTGRSLIHTHLYKKQFRLPVSLAKHTSFEEEIDELSQRISWMSPTTGVQSTIEAHVTVIPLARSKTELSEILDNISRVKSMLAYNLGTLVVRKEDVEKIKHKHTRDYVRQLAIQSHGLTGERLAQLLSISGSEYIIAASACTNSILLASTGNAFPNVQELSWDPATQEAVVFAIIKLTGIHQFKDFAKEIGFLDQTTELTRTKPGV